MVREIGGGSNMLIEEIAGVKIYRPRRESNVTIRGLAEPDLRSKFAVGTFKETEEVQAIIQDRVAFFGDLFDSLIPSLASRNLLEFVLWQYDLGGTLDDLLNSGKLQGKARQRWAKVGPTHQRTLKYIAERTTMLAPGEMTNGMPTLDLLDRAFISAEELVIFCITSDLTRIFPQSTTISIRPKSQSTYLDHKVEANELSEFTSRIPIDARARAVLFDKNSFEQNFLEHSKELDEPFIKAVGLTYTEALRILASLRDACRADPKSPMGIKFVLRAGIVKRLAEVYAKPIETFEKLLAGFSLSKENLLNRAKGGKDYWNPQFHYRAYRRAFFVMPHSLGDHIAFCNRMFDEAMTILQAEVSYGQFPNEWQSSEIKAALGSVVRRRGEWFEAEVCQHLSKLDILGVASRTSIGKGKYTLKLLGEFDFLGWSRTDKALVLLEAKMLQPGSEARLWRSQIEAFTTGNKKEESFISKLDRKCGWTVENLAAISKALQSEGIEIEESPTKLLAGFISYAPLAASYFVSDYPCVALTEFIADYEKVKRWPYATGIKTVYEVIADDA
jgi:hypothetical protein